MQYNYINYSSVHKYRREHIFDLFMHLVVVRDFSMELVGACTERGDPICPALAPPRDVCLWVSLKKREICAQSNNVIFTFRVCHVFAAFSVPHSDPDIDADPRRFFSV